MKFSVLYRIPQDNRAPEFPRLENYEDAGSVDAASHSRLFAAFSKEGELPGVREKRALRIGDIVKDELNRSFIVTSGTRLALVTLVDA